MGLIKTFLFTVIYSLDLWFNVHAYLLAELDYFLGELKVLHSAQKK